MDEHGRLFFDIFRQILFSGRSWGGLGRPWGGLGGILGGSGGVLGMVLGGLGAILERLVEQFDFGSIY